MACQVTYRNGKIETVLDANGNPSRLFSQIAKIPHMKGMAEALESYKNYFSKKFQSQDKPAIASELRNFNSSNYANLTEDGEGNFVFYHVGNEGYKTINTSSGSSARATSREESIALSKVGGVAMYYTKPEDGETMVTGTAKYMVKIPMNKVYDTNSDPLNLKAEARQRHLEDYPTAVFDGNTSAAYMTMIAGERGFDMAVVQWGDRTRAQTTQSFTPVDVQINDGNTILKSFTTEYTSNSKKGYKSVIPQTREDVLDEVYSIINSERNSRNIYDKLYHMATDYNKYSQVEITNLIVNSDLSPEIKDRYFEALRYQEGSRKSVIETSLNPLQQEEIRAQRSSKEWFDTEVLDLPASDLNQKDFRDNITKGKFVILTGENPEGLTFSNDENSSLNNEAYKWLSLKYKTYSVVGKYGQGEKSFYIPNMSREDAIDFLFIFNQDSVLTQDGLLYKDGRLEPRNKSEDSIGIDVSQPDTDFVTAVKLEDGSIIGFSLGIDFDNPTYVPLSAQTEPNLDFKTDTGNIFKSYREALNDSTGGNIEIGIMTDEFNSLFSVSSNTNTGTVDGFVNSYIKSGLLSDSKIIEDGETYFKAEGKGDIKQVVNEFIATEDAKLFLGTKNVTLYRDGRISIQEGKGTVTIGNRTLPIASFMEMSNEDIIQEFPSDADTIIISKALKESVLDRAFGDEVIEPLESQLSEPELKTRLLSLLEKMGVKTMSIEKYQDSYETRNGVEPSANALSDLANQIIAFKNGEIELSALTEETAHFIVEAWNQGDLSDLLRNINRTPEWTQFSETYRNLYREQAQNEEELDMLVRKEILGKVLANAMQTNFSSETSNQTILDYIRNLFNSFLDSVNRLFSESYEKELQDFTNQVNDLILNQDISAYLNLQYLQNKKFVMYQVAPTSGNSTIDSILKKSKGLLQILQQQEKDLLKADKGSRSNVKKLQELSKRIDTVEINKSVAELLNTANRQAKYISQAADLANAQNSFLSNEENIVYHSLTEIMSPMLSEMKEYLSRENSPESRELRKQIDEINTQVSTVVGKVRSQDNKILEDIVDRLMVRHNLENTTMNRDGQEKTVKEMLMDATKTALSDTTAFYATFGQLSHSRDPLLNMAGTIIHDITFESNANYLNSGKKFQRRIKELGFKEQDLTQFFDKGYILDVRDWAAFNEKELDVETELIREISGTSLTNEQLKELKRNPQAITGESYPELTIDQNREFNKRYKEAMRPYIETIFTEQYYKDEEVKYKDNNISEATIRERKDLSTDRGVLFSRVRQADGKLRFTNQDRIDMNALNLKRRKLKSLYNEFGKSKTGINVTPGTLDNKIQNDKIEVNGNIIEINRAVASEEAIIAFDLNKLDILYQKEVESGNRENPDSLSDEFLVELDRIESEEGRQAALDFFTLNTFTTFSSSFWDSLSQGGKLTDALDDIAGMEGTRDMLMGLQEQRKHILRQYQSQLNASETLVEDMPDNVKDEVLNLTEEIDRLIIEASRMMGDTRSDEEIIVSENTPNQAYYDAIADEALDTTDGKINFIIKNTSFSNRRKIIDFQTSVRELQRTGQPLPAKKQLLYNRFDQGNPDATLLKYAESKLAPYYKRFAPEGFNEMQRRLETSTESVGSIAREMNSNDNLQVTNNFSYYEAEEQAYRNENYKNNFEGGYLQPKISEFRNTRFQEMFNPTIVDGEVVSVGKNQDLYTLYNEMINFQRESLTAMGELGSHNIFKAPQISKSGMNKFFDFMKKDNKKETALESLKDALFYRVDDQAYGAEVEGEWNFKQTGVRVIPKYYMRDLENPTDVSEDLFYSLNAFAQQAYLYQSRKSHFSDLKAIEDALTSNERRYPDGKAAEATATVKMFRSHVDAYLFGIKESKQLRVTLPVIGQVDLTKNVRFLHKWVMNRNLGFNLVVPFTSWVTAESSTFIEKYVQEYLNPYSSGLARNEFAKLSTAAFKDTFELESKAKINVLGEYVGIYNVAERYENSIYSKSMRSIPKLGMMLNQAANFPIIPRVMLNVLYDYRIVDGNILNFNQFEKNRKAQGIASKDIVVEWKTLEDKAFYNYMNVGTTVEYDYAKLKADMNSELSDEDFRNFVKEREKGVITRVREIVKVVDGQIPDYERSAAQRHFFLSFFTTHRGWLAIAYARRFKNRHINLQTGQDEQGSYRSFGNFISRNFGNLYNKGFSNFLKDIKQDWIESDEIERKNLRRVMIELGILQGIIAVGWLLGAMADDDENKDLYSLQLTNYLYYRLMNENTSAQVGVMGEFYSLIKSPIVGADTVKSIFSVANYFDTDEIKTGRYAGMYKFQKQLMNTIPGYKSSIDLADPKGAYDSYKHFNDGVETYNPVMWVLNSEQ